MKIRSLHPVLIAVLSLLVFAPLHAQTTVTWIGGLGTPINNVNDDNNWSDLLEGDGSDSFGFDNTATTFTPVISTLGMAVNDITFSWSDALTTPRPNYTFSGESDANPTLTLNGNLNAYNHYAGEVGLDGNVTFGSSLSLLLSDAPHTASIDTDITVTVNGVITGAGSLSRIIKEGGGNLALNGLNTFNGGVRVNAGSLLLGSSSSLNTDSMIVSGPVGTGVLTLYSDGTLGVAPSAGPITLHNDILLLSNDDPTHINTSNGDLSLQGVISGGGSIYVTGTGSLTLTGNNTFSEGSSGLTVESGSLLLGHNNAAGTGTLTLNSGVTLAPTSSITLANTINLTGVGEIKVGDCATTFDLTLNGIISGAGAIGLHGYGDLALNGNNSSWSGGLHLYGDNDVYVTNSNALGSGALTFATYENYSSVYLNQSVSIYGLSGGYYYFSESSGGNEIDLNRNVKLSISQATDSRYDGAIRGISSMGVESPSDNGLGKYGIGKLTLGGPSYYYGNTDLNGGTLADGAANSFSPNSTVTITPGATLQVNFNETIGGLGDSEGGGTVAIGSGANLTINNILANSFSGVISGAGNLTKSGLGNLSLGNNNTFTGDFYVGGGTVNLNGNTAAGLGMLELGSTATVNFNTSAPVIYGLSATSSSDSVTLLSPATLTINQTENTDFKGIITGGIATSITKTGSGKLIFSNANSYGGTTTISGGTLVYGATGAFGTSSVVINGGALKLASGFSSIPNTLTLTSGTLAGNWTFATPQTFGDGITLSPGNSPGTMTFSSDLTLTGTTGASTIEINAVPDNPGVSADLFAVTGDLNLTGLSNYTLNVISLLPDNSPGAVSGLGSSASWTIFTATTITDFVSGGSQFTIDSSGFSGGGLFSVSLGVYLGNPSLVLNFTAVPEPSTYALMLAGLGLSGLAAWRKRRRA